MFSSMYVVDLAVSVVSFISMFSSRYVVDLAVSVVSFISMFSSRYVVDLASYVYYIPCAKHRNKGYHRYS
jgi:hypothetical protein